MNCRRSILQLILQGKLPNDGHHAQLRSNLEKFLCNVVQHGDGSSGRLTPGGMLYMQNLENNQAVTSTLCSSSSRTPTPGGGKGLAPVRRREPAAGAARLLCALTGSLPPREEPHEDELHGRVWEQVPAAAAPPRRRVAAVHQLQPGEDHLQRRIQLFPQAWTQLQCD